MTTETIDTSAAQSTESTPSTPVADTTLLSGNDGAATTQPTSGDNTNQAAATPAQTDGSNPPGENQAASTEPAKAEPVGAPEKYEFKATEGSVLAEPFVNAFSETAKELNLSQDAAQKLIDKMQPVIQEQQVAALNDVVTKQSQAWAEAAKVDKEFGGEKLNENLAIAKKAAEQFSTPELREMLEKTGLGNNPEVLRMFYRVGKAVSEDSFIGGAPKGSADKGEVNFAKSLYPNQS